MVRHIGGIIGKYVLSVIISHFPATFANVQDPPDLMLLLQYSN
jgi:hypothetical protein